MASPGDLCTLIEVKEAGRISQSTSDARIERFITAASRALRRWSGREFAPVSDQPQTRTFDVGRWAAGRELPIGDLAATPTAVTVLDAQGVLLYTVTVATELVLLPLVREPDEPITALRFRPGVPLAPACQVTVTGEWGFPAVPADVKEACVAMVREWLRSTQDRARAEGAVDETADPNTRAVPYFVRTLLRDYRGVHVG